MAFSIDRAKCEGCDACSTACPTQAISGKMYAKHEIDPDICVSCGLCADFCEHGAVLNDAGEVVTSCAWEDWGIPEFDTSKCTGCSLCVENCPMYALELTGPEYHGDTHTHAYLAEPQLCIGCEKCVQHCPIGAVSMISRS